MANPFAHEPEMEARETGRGLRARPIIYELRRPEGVREHRRLHSPRGTYVCRLCRTVYAPKPPDKDDLVCPMKLLQVMKEKLL